MRAKGHHSAKIDYLTGLYNRHHFEIVLKRLIARGKRHERCFSLLLVDIDNFKKINDRFGHPVGDKILRSLASTLKKSTRKVDLCFRYGGDEFTVILPDAGKVIADKVASRLKDRVELKRFNIKGRTALSLRFSIGIAVFPEDGVTPSKLIQVADQRLYQLKRQKKRRRKIWSPLVLETKLILPDPKPKLLSRPRLLSQLDKNIDKRVILIIADAGYGKTTLISQWLREQNIPFLYYNLDKDDGEPGSFLAHFIHGLRKVRVDLGDQTRRLMSSGMEMIGNFEPLVGTLINEIEEKIKDEVLIVLDDYHNLPKNSLVHSVVEYLINHTPQNLHIIISSRSYPPLSALPRLSAKTELFELHRDDLRFTREELRTFLESVYRITLTEGEIKDLDKMTEGWITGIQILLQRAHLKGEGLTSLVDGTISFDSSLFNYFVSEVVKQEPPKVQRFLKSTSILRVITPAVCDHILAIDNSKAILKGLERRCIFLFKVEREGYRYHPLFRDFLLNLLHEGEKKALYLKAGDYYRNEGRYREAIEYYLSGCDYKEALRLIKRIAPEQMRRAGFSRLKGWLTQIPSKIIMRMPWFLTLQGNICLEEGAYEKAELFYERAVSILRKKVKRKSGILAEIFLQQGVIRWRKGEYKSALKKLRLARKYCPKTQKKTMGHILNLIGITWTSFNKERNALNYLRKALQYMRSLDQPYGSFLVEHNILTLFHDNAKKSYEGYRSLITRIDDHYYWGVGIVFNNAMRSALDYGDYRWAEQCLQRGWDLCRGYHDPQSLAALHCGSGILHIEKGNWSRARHHLMRSFELLSKLGWLKAQENVLLETSRLYRYQSDFESASKTLDQIRENIYKGGKPCSVNYQFELILLNLARGDVERLPRMVRGLMKLAEQSGKKRKLFFALLASAAVFWHLNKKQRAKRDFIQMVRLAQRQGYEGILSLEIRHTQPLRDLAITVVKEGERLGFLKDLLRRYSLTTEVISVRLLGDFELQVDGVNLIKKLKRRTTRAILAYFLLHPKRGFTWEEIASWVWPESAPAVAHQMFKTGLWEIRNCAPELKSVIRYTHGRYTLNPEVKLWVDVWEFERLLRDVSLSSTIEEKEKSLERADNLYRGPLLSDLYYTWVEDYRNALKRIFVEVLGELARSYARKEDYEKSVSYCVRALKIDRLNEDIHRLLLRNYISLGQKAKALKHYEDLREMLHKELNCEPSTKTKALIKSLY